MEDFQILLHPKDKELAGFSIPGTARRVFRVSYNQDCGWDPLSLLVVHPSVCCVHCVLCLLVNLG